MPSPPASAPRCGPGSGRQYEYSPKETFSAVDSMSKAPPPSHYQDYYSVRGSFTHTVEWTYSMMIHSKTPTKSFPFTVQYDMSEFHARRA